MKIKSRLKSTNRKAFSLIEVVLAMGIFLITVLALVGLLGPALKSVSTVRQTDEVTSVVDSVNAFLNSSPWINPGGSRFEAIYRGLETDEDYSTLFVYRWRDGGVIRLEVGYEDNQGGTVGSQDGAVDDNAVVNVDRAGDGIPAAAYNQAAGSIYRVVLTASSAMLPDGLVDPGLVSSYPRYTLNRSIDVYDGSYLALEVRIFVEATIDTPAATNIATLANEVPVFVYNTAILRD